jgi:UDP-4-amino-4,6-dideoxy-N-acetyl-beta-L-altrosamine transaminase
MSYIPYGRQNISEDDIQAVVDILRSEYLTQGPAVPAFEEAVASLCDVQEAVAVNSATSALHIACLALGVGAGDIVWTTPVTFVASANCALYCGANVDFVDIDPKTYNISVDQLERKLEEARRTSHLPKVVIVVHMCGQPCEMDRIAVLSQRYGFHVIEDASHAIGSSFQGIPTGNCKHSDITIFSFHPVKIITTAEGGMAVTKDANLAKRMRLLRSHGITRSTEDMINPSEGGWYYEQLDLGFNYRITDVQAALGLSQMKRLGAFLADRNRIANRYADLLANMPIQLPWIHPQAYSSFHLYVIRLQLDYLNRNSRADIFQALRDHEIGVNLHYIPVYRQPYYQKLGFPRDYCPEAEQYYAEAISLPIYPHLSAEEQERVAHVLREVLSK